MWGEIRKSGIDVIGDVTWGTHFCQFYQTKQDLIDTLVPYFKAGLENNEFCMWVTADNLTVEEARKAMTKAMKGFSTYIKKGQIEILPYTEWYLRGGTFNSQNVLNGWIEKLNQALKKGYDGLRLTGDTFWLENKDWRDFTEYEASVNNIIGQYKIIALCTYYLDKCGNTEIVDVIRNHEFTLIKRNGKWELFESSRYKNIKEELKENEKRFRLALKNAPVTVAAQDSDLRFLWAYNRRTVRPEDVLGKTDFEVFPKVDAEKLSSLKHRVLQTGKSINKKMWVTSNGRKVYLDIFLEPTKDQNGKVIGVEVGTVDLTRQKLMEEALQESEQKYRKIFNSMSEGLAHCEILNNESGKPVDYRFLDVNPIFERFIGLPKEQIIGKTIRTILPNVQLKAIETFAKVVSSGEPVHFENHSRDLKKWFDVYAYRAQPGQFAYMVIDITARKQAENTLKESEERFRVLSEVSPVIISVTRASDGIVLYVNKSYSESLGYIQEELIGKTALNVYYDPAERKALIDKLNEKGFLQNYEVRIKKADGTPFWASTSVRFINFGGERAIIAASIDITELKRAEEQKIMLTTSVQKEKDRLSALVNSIPDEVWFADTNKNFTLANPSALREFKFNDANRIDVETMASNLEVLSPDGTPRPVDEAPPLRALKGEIVKNQEEMVRTPATGELRYRQVNAAPVRDAAGNIVGSVSVVRDITTRKKVEEDLKRLNRELQAIRECDQAIVHSGNEITLLSDVCRILCTTAGYSLAWIGAVEYDEAKSVRPLVWQGDESYLAGVNVTWADTEKGRGPTGMAIRTGKTHFIQDFAIEPKAVPWREAALSRDYRSSIAIPLKANEGSVFAVLCLYSPEPNSFNPAEVRLLEELGNDISFGVSALREKAKRQQAEAELAHIASFPELDPNPIIEMDGKGHSTYMNPAAKEQLPDFSTSGLKHPFLVDGKALAQRLKDDPEHPINRQIQVEESWYEQTLMYVPAKNTYRLYARDITKSKKAEDVLKESEERNRLILATTLDGVWINDLSGRLLYVNDAYCHMIGYAREELLKMYIHDVEAKEKQEETNEHIKKIIRRGGDVFETRHKRKDGGIIDIEISAKYVNTGNGQFIVFARDITERKKFESEMKSSEERFSKAFHSSPVALSISRISDGEFIDLNQSFLQLFGYQREEIIGQKATELNIYDNPKDRNEIVRLLQQEGRVINYEVTAHTKTGREIKALTSAEKINVSGLPHIIWTTIDISERQQAEDLLRETSNYLNNLLDYANTPIIVWDSHFRISRFNPAFERLTGYKSGDVIGLDLGILFPENKKAESLELIQLTLAGERWEVVEIPISRVDGEIRTVLWNSANVYDTGGKAIISTIAQGQDITERKRVEESLRETTDYLNNLLDYANAPIIVWDTEFHITRFNHAFERLTGFSAGEAMGKSLDILFPEDSKFHSMEHIRSTVSGEHWEVVEIPILQRNGAVRIVLWNSATLFGDDGKMVVATIAQGQDITERKQAEEEIKKLNEELKHRATELEAANRELEAFSYSVSHDLRAPLRSMEGFSQALQEDCKDILNDECKNYLSRIQNSAELMAQLIDDMLRLSHITRADMDMEKISLTEIARNIAARLKYDEPKRDVKFVVTPELTAYGDGKLIGIMMGNLFENAWKFTRKTPEAQIEFGVTERDGQTTYFVRDNGVGFDMKYADKLFKPFQRLHSIEEFPGTGIGLASVQRIVQRHGGRVWAEGKTGEGATVYFTLG